MDEQLKCPECGSSDIQKNGTKIKADGTPYQKIRCKVCKANSTISKTSGQNQPVKSVTSLAVSTRLTETELRAKHDNHYKVVKAAQALERGFYIENRDFTAALSLSGTSHSRWTGNTAFDKYRGKAGGITYWSHPESIAKMKADGVFI